MKELCIQNWIFIATGMFLAILGIVIQQLKLYSLIAGYNTSSPVLKRKVNIAQVAIALRNAFLLIGVIWIVVPITVDLLKLNMIVKVLLVLFGHVGISLWLISTTNKKEKYKINSGRNSN
jgi:hypothetical protein